MRVLLDTNQILIIVQDPSRMTARARDVLREGTTELFVSAVSLWEIDLNSRARRASGESRLPLAAPISAIVSYFMDIGAKLLPLEPHHIATELKVRLPTNDPFDWMHLKQSQVENLSLLTSDRALATHPLVIAV
jgi:PIN domain nuclease of toxin-antitoxin system